MVPKIINNKGYVLFTTISLIICGTTLILAFYSSLGSKELRINYKIAETKALYNAETGIAERAYPFLITTGFEKDTVLEGKTVSYDNINMGVYLGPELTYANNGDRVATVEGVGFIFTSKGELDSIKKKVSVSARAKSLGQYMYLTASEKAGGAPFSHGPSGVGSNPVPANQRRPVFFGSADVLNGLVKSMDDIALSNSTACADFSSAKVELSPGKTINIGACSSLNNLFGCSNNDDECLDEKLDTTDVVLLPPPGYEKLKNNASKLLDAGIKIGDTGITSKDTLIMTDLEFREEGSVIIKQWWYLIPPHMRANPENPTIPSISDLDGVVLDINGDPFYNNDGDNNPFNNPLQCADVGDLRTCEPYIDSLYFYHGKGYDLNNNTIGGTLSNMPNRWYNSSPDDNPGDNANEEYVSVTSSSSHGINNHFDFEPLDGDGQVDWTSLLLDQEYFPSGDAVIYVKDGPVRVSGVYNGRYTVVTDEYTTYRRHASRSIFAEDIIDTVWNNIWITGDLINADAIGQGSFLGPEDNLPQFVHSNGNLIDFQPNEDCSGASSSNSMGLVSGANVIIANTIENGARGCLSNIPGQCDIIINAGIIALNESFVMHYWQNSSTQTNQQVSAVGRTLSGNTWEPPWGDGRGQKEYPGANTDNFDKRREIYLWGSVVQKFRGYMLRNPNSPYGGTVTAGMDKNYHYDRNLDCTPPPFYPEAAYDNESGELEVNLVGFKKVE